MGHMILNDSSSTGAVQLDVGPFHGRHGDIGHLDLGVPWKLLSKIIHRFFRGKSIWETIHRSDHGPGKIDLENPESPSSFVAKRRLSQLDFPPVAIPRVISQEAMALQIHLDVQNT